MALGCERLRVLERGECHVVRSGRTLRTLKALGGACGTLVKCIVVEGGGRKQFGGRGNNFLVCWFDSESWILLFMMIERGQEVIYRYRMI